MRKYPKNLKITITPLKTSKMTMIYLKISRLASKILKVTQKQLSSVFLEVSSIYNYVCKCVSLVDNFCFFFGTLILVVHISVISNNFLLCFFFRLILDVLY